MCVCVWSNGRIMKSRWKSNNFEEEPGLAPVFPTRIAERLSWESEIEHSLFLTK